MERIRITANIGGGPVIMQGLALSTPFDSLLAWAAIDKAEKKADKRISQEEADNIINDLPLRKVFYGDEGKFLYAASVPAFADLTVTYRDYVTIHKSMTRERMLDKLDSDILRNLSQKTGPWKTSSPSYMPVMTEGVEWIVDGDIDAIKDIISSITHIGKKRSIGYGRVVDGKMKCEPVGLGEATLKRYLPAGHFKVTAELAIPVLPPYWRHETKMVCGLGELDKKEGHHDSNAG